MKTEKLAIIRSCPRPDLAVVRVSGQDARSFLHGQTTQSFNDIPQMHARMAAWLSPQGRVLALFDAIATDDAVWLVVPEDNTDYLIEALRRFILRATVTIDRVAGQGVHSVCGDIDAWLATGSLDLAAGRATRIGQSLCVRMSPHRIDVLGSPDSALPGLARPAAGSIEEAIGEAVAAGRPQINAALRERYLPQMLNLDRLDAVSFTKGCYPGQEIVARTTNLGEVKRRLQRYCAAGGDRPQPGEPVVDDAGQSAGEVNCCASRDDGFELLAVTRLAGATRLRLAADGRDLTPEALPYAV